MAEISNNNALTLDEMARNVDIIVPWLMGRGWASYNAIAAVLGNMQQESTINPGRWQNGEIKVENGFGLVQWTPSTNVTVWLSENGYEQGSLTGQLEKIEDERATGTQYYQTAEYPVSFNDFIVSSSSIDYLTAAFMYNYERPDEAEAMLDNRRTYAKYWYKYITGKDPGPEPPGPEPPVVYGTKGNFIYYLPKKTKTRKWRYNR